jgi:hypothetical protein
MIQHQKIKKKSLSHTLKSQVKIVLRQVSIIIWTFSKNSRLGLKNIA